MTIVQTGNQITVLMRNVEQFQHVKPVEKILFVVFVSQRINVFMVHNLVLLINHVRIIHTQRSIVQNQLRLQCQYH